MQAEEDEELEVALALSLLEMKSDQPSTPSQDALHQKRHDGPNQRGSFQPVSVSQAPASSSTQLVDVVKSRESSALPQTGAWVKSGVPKSNIENEQRTSQTVCAPSPYSFPSGQDTVKEGMQVMLEEDLNQSEKPKRSKNRRQRRKGASQHVVGMPVSPSAPPPVLLWFRRDLRLCDNPALNGSLEVGAPVIPVFIWSPEEEEGPGVTVAMGGACKLLVEPLKVSLVVILLVLKL